MSTVSPSPDSSPSADPPTSNPSPPSPLSASSPSDSSTTPITTAQPDQTSDPPTPSAPSPPLTPPSPPPESSASPPPLPPASPPPSPPASPPPPPPAAIPPSSPASPPPSSPAAKPPASPPPPDVTPPPPSDSSPPAPSGGSPPPQPSPTPPSASPPPPQDASPSPPPPPNVPAPHSSTYPPPPVVKAPESSPPPTLAPPSDPQSSPPLPSNSSSTPTLAAQPPTVPSSSAPPPNSLPAPPSNSSSSPTVSPLPSIPTEKPIATNGTGLTENSASIGNQGLSTGGAVAIGVVVSFVLLSFVVMAAWFVQKRKKRAAGSKPGYTTPSPFSSQNSDAVFLRTRSPVPLIGSGSGTDYMYSSSEMSNSRSWFTYQDLAEATNGFSAQYLLGEGGFGCVYKGVLTDGRKVAVKQLKIGGGQGEREFRAEVEIIGRVHHRHLVSLVGYCISDHQRLLVYDYVPNDTLHHHLHGQNKLVLDWATRVKVAAGAARGIAYLHEDCHPRIIHRDIKSSNILLDSNFEAQVSDFGLAKLALDTCTHVSTRVMGTFGYMAPEYATSGKLTEKSDVYSYGVVLLELITGRKPVDDSQPMGDESLVEWARPLLAQALDNGDFEGLVDPSLEKNYIDTELFRMIEAAAACVRHSAAKRPRMSQVVRALDSVGESSDLSNGMKLGQSEIYDSAQQSAQIKMFRKMAFGSQNYNSSYFGGSQSSWESREHDI